MEGKSEHLRVVVLFPHRVGRACEHGQLHPGNQGVVDGGVRQPGTIWRPPMGDMGLENLLWKSEKKITIDHSWYKEAEHRCRLIIVRE